MSLWLFDISGLEAATTYRVDSASGSESPTTVAPPGLPGNGTQHVRLQPGQTSLRLASALYSALYLKKLDYLGAATGTVVSVTSTWDLEDPANPIPDGTVGTADLAPGVAYAAAFQQGRRFGTENNSVAQQTQRVLTDWLAWLSANGSAKGSVTEIGFPSYTSNATYPGQDVWNWGPVAEGWFNALGTADVVVSQWLDPTGVFAAVDNPRTARPSFGPSAIPILRSVTAGVRSMQAGSAAGVAPPTGFSNASTLATYPTTNWFQGQQFYDLLAGAGIGVARVSFRWELIQKSMGGALDQAMLDALDATLTAAESAGVRCILDVHNYGGYQFTPYTGGGTPQKKIGSAEVSPESFYDLWERISDVFSGDERVYAYELMNEPAGLSAGAYGSAAEAWEAYSQGALTAIRDNGDDTQILVPGYDYSAMARWKTNHPDGWITDTASNFRYNAHNYWSWNPTSDAEYTIPWAGANSELSRRWYNGGGGYVRFRGGQDVLLGAVNVIPPADGYVTVDRVVATSNVSMSTGTARYTLFVPEQDITVSKVAIGVGTTAASGTAPTVCRVSVNQVNADRTGTLLAATAHNASLFNGASAMTADQNLQVSGVNSSITLRKGQLYAIGVLIVGTGTFPTLSACGNTTDAGSWPWLAWTRSGLSDWDASWSSAPSNATQPFYAKLKV